MNWSYAGVDLETDKWGIKEIHGLGFGGLRGSNRQVPYKDGQAHMKKHYKEKVLSMLMYIVETETTLEENIEELMGLLGKRGSKPLTAAMNDGSIREAYAEVYGEVKFSDEKNKPWRFKEFMVEFELADPFFYDTEKENDTQIIDNKKYIWEHKNKGNAYSTKIEIKLNGPLDSPKITNKSNNIWVQYQGEILEGETVKIGRAHV